MEVAEAVIDWFGFVIMVKSNLFNLVIFLKNHRCPFGEEKTIEASESAKQLPKFLPVELSETMKVITNLCHNIQIPLAADIARTLHRKQFSHVFFILSLLENYYIFQKLEFAFCSSLFISVILNKNYF